MPPIDFSLDQECTIAQIKSITDSQYGKKVQFVISGYPHEVSCFTKFPDNMSTGAKVFGHIEVKDGKYHNFKWGKKAGNAPQIASDSRAGNLIDFKVLPALDRILARQGLIMKALNINVDETGYPQMDETNNSSGLDNIDITDQPAF